MRDGLDLELGEARGRLLRPFKVVPVALKDDSFDVAFVTAAAAPVDDLGFLGTLEERMVLVVVLAMLVVVVTAASGAGAWLAKSGTAASLSAPDDVPSFLA